MRKVILICLFLVIFLSVQCGQANGEDDTAIGNFLASLEGNESGTFLNYYDPHTLIDPYADVVFYTLIEDPDNTSDEITVTMFYSNDTFVSDNRSTVMMYSGEPEPDQYQYVTAWTGEPDNTVYHFYYKSYDGKNTVRKDDNGDYFDITWGLPRKPPSTNPIKLPTEVAKALEEIITEAMPLIIILGVTGILTANIYVAYTIFSSKHQRKLGKWKNKIKSQIMLIKTKVTDSI